MGGLKIEELLYIITYRNPQYGGPLLESEIPDEEGDKVRGHSDGGGKNVGEPPVTPEREVRHRGQRSGKRSEVKQRGQRSGIEVRGEVRNRGQRSGTEVRHRGQAQRSEVGQEVRGQAEGSKVRHRGQRRGQAQRSEVRHRGQRSGRGNFSFSSGKTETELSSELPTGNLCIFSGTVLACILSVGGLLSVYHNLTNDDHLSD